MTSILVLLALLSLATLASRRGAFEELVQSASTPLLVGVGVLISPSILGVLPPSTLAGLEPAVDLGASALAFFIGARAVRFDGAPLDRRVLIAGIGAVVASCVAALAVLGGAALLGGGSLTDRSAWAAPLLAGACLAGLPAESVRTEARVRAWAHVTELAALGAALAALLLAARDPLTLALAALALGVAGAAVLALEPRTDPVTRTVALLGMLAFSAGLMRLIEIPTAASGFLAGVLTGRTSLGAEARGVARRAERPIRVVLTIVVAASSNLDWAAAALGVALAVGQLAVQTGAARVMRVHRTLLGSALASSSTPIAWVAALMGAWALLPSLHELLPALLVAVAMSDVFAVFIGLAQRRAGAFGDERTDAGARRATEGT